MNGRTQFEAVKGNQTNENGRHHISRVMSWKSPFRWNSPCWVDIPCLGTNLLCQVSIPWEFTNCVCLSIVPTLTSYGNMYPEISQSTSICTTAYESVFSRKTFPTDQKYVIARLSGRDEYTNGRTVYVYRLQTRSYDQLIYIESVASRERIKRIR